MNCPHCQSSDTKMIKKKTLLGYKQFICNACSKQYNERTGTKLNFIMYPTAVVMMVVHYYYRFKVSLDDVVELMLMRGFRFMPSNRTQLGASIWRRTWHQGSR